jgi:multicomponent Na+:H+ antiporter subunit D
MISGPWRADIDPLAPLPVAVPLLVAAALAAFASFWPRWVVDAVAVCTAGFCTVTAIVLGIHAADGHVVYWFAGWHPRHGVAIGIDFAIDAFGAGLAAVVSFLVTAALTFSTQYFEEEAEQRFVIIMLVFLGAMVGFSLTGDLFDLFVFFELLSVAAYALTAYRIEQPGPLQGAFNFAVINSLGSFCLLLGIAMVYARTGALNLAQIGNALAGHGVDRLVAVAFALLVVGFFVKAGVVPFHFWLADAYAVVPTPVGVLFAGIMSELGLYAVVRLYWTAFEGSVGAHGASLRPVLMGMGVITALVGAVMTFAQQHIKRLLAFSTITHIGLYLIGIGLLDHVALAGVAVYVVAHGLVKGALFLCAAILIYRLASIDEEHLRGRGRVLPVTGVVFAIGGLALAELPPFGPFLGKTLIEDAGARAGYHFLPWIFGICAAVTGGAVLRAAGRVFLGWGPRERDRFASERIGEAEMETGEGHERHRTTRVIFLIPTVALMAGGLALGMVPGLSGHVEQGAHEFQDRRSYQAAVLRGEAEPERPVDVEPPSALGAFYGLASGAAAVALALVALFRRRLVPASTRRAVAARFGPVIRRLRLLHSGHVGDYAAWFAVGLLAVLALFAVALR